MTTQTKVQKIATQLHDLTSEELLTLNKYLCSIVKERNTVKRMQATIGFKVGDKVQFTDSRSGTTRSCVVDKIKRVMIAVTETSTSARPGLRWNVAANLLKKV